MSINRYLCHSISISSLHRGHRSRILPFGSPEFRLFSGQHGRQLSGDQCPVGHGISVVILGANLQRRCRVDAPNFNGYGTW